MQFWTTPDGTYYESENKINNGDFRVPRRPNRNCVYVNGQWVMPINDDSPEYDTQQITQRQRYVEPSQIYVQPPPPQQHEEKKKDEVTTLSNSTRVLFGIKEIFMVGTMVVTATISWQDTNSKLTEAAKAINALEVRVKTLEGDIRTNEKQTRSDFQKIEQNIREVEQVLFMPKKEQK